MTCSLKLFRTRFAPSPTGYLHLGHVAHALFVWGIGRAAAAEIVLRIEDHDRQRCRPVYEAALLEDLNWLGLEPDQPRVESFLSGPSEYRQSDCGAVYRAAAARLAAQGLIYACSCSRAEILRRTEPQGGELCYDNHCASLGRMGEEALEQPGALRLRLDPGTVAFEDLLLGRQVQRPAEQCGDLLIRDRLGHWTYQFCVVVDDLRQGINLVIRGTDLLASTGRQLQIASLLGNSRPIQYLHHPLLTDPAGRKLSKRDFDRSICELRSEGWTAAAVLCQAAHRAGLAAQDCPISTSEMPDLIFRSAQLKGALQRLQSAPI